MIARVAGAEPIVRGAIVQELLVAARYGWELAGAWETSMVDESECFVLWALPTWESWPTT